MSDIVIVLPGGCLAYDLADAERVVPFSKSTLERAAKKPRNDGMFPPPLATKRDSKGRRIVLSTALQAWLESLDDS